MPERSIVLAVLIAVGLSAWALAAWRPAPAPKPGLRVEPVSTAWKEQESTLLAHHFGLRLMQMRVEFHCPEPKILF